VTRYRAQVKKAGGLVGLALLLSIGVACVFQEERNANLQVQHAVTLVEGYRDFKVLYFDTDMWVQWFQYRLPQGSDSTEVSGRIAAQVARANRCFEAMELTVLEARLRCRTDDQSFQEYLIRVLPEDHRVLVMYAQIDGDTELKHYPETVDDFRARR
jgi:hypothetical protein